MGAEAPIEHDPRWPVVSLAEIATKIGSGATPKGGADAYLPSRARFALVRSQNVFDRRFDHDGLAFISDEQADGLRGVVLQPDDILLNITGDGITFGRACMVPTDVLPACVNQHVSIIRLDPQRADAGYVLAFLTHRDVKSYIESFNAGGSRRAVTKGHIESFRLPLPPLPEQHAIAHILGTLDDKIELNRRMNETLEAMARALFKSWFVDFDPVRAKAEGRDPSLPKPIAGLFPDSFENSVLGGIPKGWRLAPLPDLIDVNPTRALRKGVEAPYLDMANMPTRGHSPDDVVDRAFRSGMRFMNGDTLVARITPCLENGKTAFVDFLKPTEVGWGSTEYIVLRPKPPLPEEFAYCLARSAEFRDFAIQSMTGSSGRQRVPAESLSHFLMVAAPKSIAEVFGRLIKPLFARASAAVKEARALAAIRDTLLPRLISGELRSGCLGACAQEMSS
ncbi:MAG: restriction endonuclease subunit S [Burkholderiales bacterium]